MPVKLVNKLVNGALGLASLKLERCNVVTDPELQLLAGLSLHKVSKVIDVGANKGQFASSLFKAGYKGEIVSIEPLARAYEELVSAAKDNENWFVAERCVIGDSAGEATINVSENSVSSSVMPMLDLCSEMAPSASYVGAERVQMRTLDTVALSYIKQGQAYFVKIDTQGFEWSVIEGAPVTLSGAVGVLCELSLVPLYEGQKLWLEVVTRLEAMGFSLWAVQPVFSDHNSGRALQMDAIFFRST